ncbi:MAG TPA: peptide-binding protein [Desulfobulbus sp.]|nr:peptide-binding protein [Desulfobulbus sp.]
MGKDRLMNSVRIGAVAMAMLCATAGLGLAAEYVSVIKDDVNLRSGPDTKYEVLYQLPSGYPLKVLSRQGKWIKVADFENDRGWIYGSLVSKTPYVIVKVREGNVRSGPGRNYSKVGSVAREVILKKVATKGDWIKISHPRISGWIHKSLVWP